LFEMVSRREFFGAVACVGGATLISKLSDVNRPNDLNAVDISGGSYIALAMCCYCSEVVTNAELKRLSREGL